MIGSILTQEALQDCFPFPGGSSLAQSGIDKLGEQDFILSVLPIYNAICQTQRVEFGEAPSVAMLAEALQYRDIGNLECIAKYGLQLKELYLLELCRGSHALAVRAEAILRVCNGGPACFRALLQAHDYTNGKEPIMPYDKDVNDYRARRKAAGA